MTNRIDPEAELQELHRQLEGIIEEREVAFGDHPVGRTGLCSRTFKIVGREFPMILEEYRLDRQLLRELAKIRKTVAIELGQYWPLSEFRREEAAKRRVARKQAAKEQAARDRDSNCLKMMARLNAGRDIMIKEQNAREAAAAKSHSEAFEPGGTRLDPSEPSGAPERF